MLACTTVPAQTRIVDVVDEVAHRAPWHHDDEVAWALIVSCGSPDLGDLVAPLVTRAHELAVAVAVHHGSATATVERQAALLTYALGRVATTAGPHRRRARSLLDRFVGFSPVDPFALALVALSAAQVLDDDPGSLEASAVLSRSAARLRLPRADEAWLWPQPELTEMDGLLPDALMAAGVTLGAGALVRNGLALLEWRSRVSVDPDRLTTTQRLWEAIRLGWAYDRAQRLTADDRWAGRTAVLTRRVLIEPMGLGVDLTTATRLMRHHLASLPVAGCR